MGVITRALVPASRALVPVEPEVIRAPLSSPKNNPSAVISAVYNGRVAVPNSRIYRHWSRVSEWIRGGINIRRSQVSSADWDIVPFDQTRPYSKRMQQKIRDLIRTPNPANDSFRTLIEPTVEDLIVLDAGCIEKVRSMDGELRELWPVDGATIRVQSNWDGDPTEHRYFWYPAGATLPQASWRNSDFIYMMAGRRNDSPIGYSPLETLRLTIEAELDAHEYNRRQVRGAAPDGVFDLGEGMTRDQVLSFRAFFESEVAGRGAIGFIGGTKGAQWIDVRKSNRDQQFLEWQIYLVRKIAVVLGLTPQDLGVTYDVNKSTGETQLQISEDRGLRPLMSLLQEYVTEEIVWDSGFGGPENNLAFRFTALNLRESTARAMINEKALAGVPWRFLNEARIDEGREPIKELDGKLIMSTPQGALDISDVPTVREFMEMQQKKHEAAPGVDSAKAIASAVEEALGRRLSDLVMNQRPMMEKGAVEVHVDNAPPQITVESPSIEVHTPAIEMPKIELHAPPIEVHPPSVTIEAADINVHPAPVTIEKGAIQVSVTSPDQPPRTIRKRVERDAEGRVTGLIEEDQGGE